MSKISLTLINDQILILVVLIVAISFISVLFLLRKMFSNNKVLKRLNALAMQRDIQISQMLAKLVDIDDRIKPLTEYHRKKEYLMELRSVIEETGEVFFESCTDDRFKQIVLHGLDEAYIFFSYIYKEGFQNISQERIMMRALNLLSKVRSSHVTNGSITVESSERIKQIAYTHIGELLRNIVALKSGIFNGKSELEYKKIVGKFLYSFIVDAHKAF